MSPLNRNAPDSTAHFYFRYAEFLLQGDLAEFPSKMYPTIRHLILAALRNFSRTSLLSAGQGLTTGATKVPLEAQFQNEIYRAVYHALGQKIFLTSEWGASSKDGRVDFLLKKVKWGIECVREGTRLDEHIQRFLPGGRYYPWIEEKQMSDYILIDFRKSMPKMPKGNKSSKFD